MFQVISAKYLGPTNKKGSRIKAWCRGGSLTMDYDHRKDCDDNMIAVIETLQANLKWNEDYYLVFGRCDKGIMRGVQVWRGED